MSARGGDASIMLTDTEISRSHARLSIKGSNVVVEDLGSTNGTFVNGQKVATRVLKDGDKIQVGTTTILKFTYHDQLDAQFQQKMLKAALHDGLTGAYNKKFFSERLESEMAFAQRHQSPLALVLFDLDHFKSLNDTYGHLAGDYVLKTLAGGIQESVRREDVFARYGGEEFVVLSRGIDLAAGVRFAERLRHWVEIYPFKYRRQALTGYHKPWRRVVPRDQGRERNRPRPPRRPRALSRKRQRSQQSRQRIAPASP